ncbi:MAG TPA: methyl-accepting chemotaxis protein [Geomonas sp.]
MLKKYLSSLKSTYYFMISFGLIMGAVFPFYSYFFFGNKAFSPLYVLGCLTAGFLVGTFCYYIIKQVMRIYLETQWETLSKIVASKGGEDQEKSGDELQMLLDGYDTLMSTVLAMVENVSALIIDIVPFYQELSTTSRHLEKGNEKQVKEVRRTQDAAEGMHRSFQKMLVDTEDLATRTDNRASIAAQMSAATDAIAENIREYSSAVSETSSSIAEMAMSIHETSGNIEGLTHSTEQTSSSIMQISAAIGNVRDNALRSSECSENVRLKAQEGMRSMEATHKAMTEIERANNESSDGIDRLAAKSARVGEILVVIQDVVQQTNLLSLNAFIIAAQAGERGKAFSVVAGEVKSLALRTANSATEIDLLVRDIQKETGNVQRSVRQGTVRVKEGVEISALTADALVKIEESATEACDMVKKIATATEEQAAGSRLITKEVENNLERAKKITSAVQEQERGTVHIIRALEQMKDLAKKIASASQDQARGNKLYLMSVMDDSEKAKNFKVESLQQLKAAEEVQGFINEAGKLIEANADVAKQIAARIEAISALTEQLKCELAPFRG